ncbi:MAG: ATP phosphoribosyltransferase regulatory subunit [Firmicutes bacterium]|nr:ATP phosphoribosyltransferase regulatory subunit [Bacillota bacterium]
MNGLEYRTQLPLGVRDYLPGEALQKKRIEDNLRGLFTGYGFQEVIPPGFEFYEAVEMGLGGKVEQTYKFFDRRGRILVLRPDFTTPLARIVATKLGAAPGPWRLCYAGSLFSYQDPGAGRPHETYQIGAELIGAPEGAADAEILSLAVEGLRRLGLQDSQIAIGHAGCVQGILEEAGLGEEDRRLILGTVARRDLVTLERIAAKLPISDSLRRILVRLPSVVGGRDELEAFAVAAGGQGAREAARVIGDVLDHLERLGLSEQVRVDLGVVRDFAYYSGIVFEGHVRGVGLPVCGGGRYDRLLDQFGSPLPATGFAFDLNSLMIALAARDGAAGTWATQPFSWLIVPLEADLYAEAARRARELRAKGLIVEVEVSGKNAEAALAYAQERGIGRITFLSRRPGLADALMGGGEGEIGPTEPPERASGQEEAAGPAARSGMKPAAGPGTAVYEAVIDLRR